MNLAVKWLIGIGIVAFALALPIAAIAIAAQNQHSTCYDQKPLVDLAVWLFVFGATSLCLGIASLCGIVGFFCSMMDRGPRSGQKCLCAFVGFVAPCLAFAVCWNIVGSVTLFRDSRSCREKAESIWNMVLISLVSQWIIAPALCLIKCIGYESIS
jgi:hypothetical protein